MSSLPESSIPAAGPGVSPVGASRRPSRPEDDRPPACPRCGRRLAILSTQTRTGDGGERIRFQLWGCPRGHATARRVAGVFQPVQLLPEP